MTRPGYQQRQQPPALKLYEAYGYEETSRQQLLLTGYFLGIRDWLYLQTATENDQLRSEIGGRAGQGALIRRLLGGWATDRLVSSR